MGLRSSWYDCCREHGGRARLALVSSTSASLVSQQLSWTLHHFAKRKSAAAGASKAVLDAALRVFAVVPGEMLPDAEWYEVLRARLQAQGSHLVGTATVMHEAQARAAADGIEAAMPNGGVVLNMLDELEESKDLLEALQERSMPAGIYEVVSIHITESDTASLGALLDDQWVALTYFATLGRSQNSLFLDAIEAKYGLDASARPAITEDMKAAWSAGSAPVARASSPRAASPCTGRRRGVRGVLGRLRDRVIRKATVKRFRACAGKGSASRPVLPTSI